MLFKSLLILKSDEIFQQMECVGIDKLSLKASSISNAYVSQITKERVFSWTIYIGWRKIIWVDVEYFAVIRDIMKYRIQIK